MKKLTPQNLLPAIRSRVEAGFTLPEILITILIIGILAGIAIPIFVTQMNAANTSETKSDLVQAATLIEQERIDNNGLYPKYLPNEVVSNEKWAKFPYSYSDNRLVFCLQADSPEGMWFVSNTDKNPTHTVCTQKNFAQNGVTPWGQVQVPSVTPTTATNTWAAGKQDATATASWAAATCNLGALSYQFRVTNTVTNGTVASAWSATPNASVILTDWLPEEAVNYQVRARCVVNYTGADYEYLGPWSSAITGTVAVFPVANPGFGTPAPATTWDDAGTVATAAWTSKPLTCVRGVAQYKFDTIQGSTTSTTGWVVPPTGTKALTSPVADAQLKYNLTVSCFIASNGKRYSSAATSVTEFLSIPAPVIPASFIADNGNGNTAVVPNRATWGSTVCVAGTLKYVFADQDAGVAAITLTGTVNPLNLSVGQVKNYKLTAFCDGVNSDSPSTDALDLTVTGQLSTPPTPTTALYINPTTVLVNTVKAVSFPLSTCPASAPNRNVQLYQGSLLLSNNTGASATITFPGTPGNYSYSYTYTCSDGAGFTSSPSASSPAVNVNVVTQTAAPTGLGVQRIYGRSAYIKVSVVAGQQYDLTVRNAPTAVTTVRWDTQYTNTAIMDATTPTNSGGTMTTSYTPAFTGVAYVYMDPVGPTSQGFSWPTPRSYPASPTAVFTTTKDGISSNPSATLTIDAPRQRVFNNMPVQFLRTGSTSGIPSLDNRLGNSLVSANGRYALFQQSDGNTVKYDLSARTSGWNTGRADVNYSVYDSTGNVAFYNSANTLLLCNPNSQNATGCSGSNMLVMEDSGDARSFAGALNGGWNLRWSVN